MRGAWHKGGLTAGLLVVVLMLATAVASAQDAEPSLGEKYKQAEKLYDQGDYAGAKQLLLEVNGCLLFPDFEVFLNVQK